MSSNASLKSVLEGVIRALGIRRNGGTGEFPYLTGIPEAPAFANDGERALRLVYLLPPGFKL